MKLGRSFIENRIRKKYNNKRGTVLMPHTPQRSGEESLFREIEIQRIYGH